MSSSKSKPTHVAESVSDRKKNRELAEARQSGTVAPEVDVKTGSMINPHNPEFITRRPWYLGGGDSGPSLDHQADQRAEEDRVGLSLASADHLIREERRRVKDDVKAKNLRLGMWVEALKKNRRPYVMCQIVKIAKNGTLYDLKFEDGTIERSIPFRKSDLVKNSNAPPRIRFTKTGNRSFAVDAQKYGKETYDSKRDAYHGYEVDMKAIENRYARREAIRRKINSSKQKQQQQNESNDKDSAGNDTNKPSKKIGSDSDSDTDYDSDDGSDSDDEFVQRDEDAMVHTSRLARQGGVGGAQMKVTARNLRIREDTAKYLRNLDPNSAYYDPKSRSMRDNPNPNVNSDELQFAGDNFHRISGDAVKLADTQLFAWDAEKRGVVEVHPQANPSQAELLKQKFRGKSAQLKAQRKKAVLDRYGGSEYLDGADGLGAAAAAEHADGDASSTQNENSAKTTTTTTTTTATLGETSEERRVRFGVSLTEERYSRDGRPVGTSGSNASSANGRRRPKLQPLTSKYEENIFQNGHTTVWGSYFHRGAFRWGHADDHSLLRNSYCTGEAGRKANDESNELQYGTGVAGSAALAQARELLKSIPSSTNSTNPSSQRHPTNSRLFGEADARNAPTLDRTKLKAAIQKQEEETKKEEVMGTDERKRKYNSLDANSNDVGEEEMEAYRLKKERTDDPMAKIGEGELLEYK